MRRSAGTGGAAGVCPLMAVETANPSNTPALVLKIDIRMLLLR
jgi:hypothetical protein